MEEGTAYFLKLVHIALISLLILGVCLMSTFNPGDRSFHAMVYDSKNNMTLLYGGL